MRISIDADIASSDRFVRQQELVPRQRIMSLSATAIGVGAIGRQVALQLAAIGMPNIQLIDFDTVEKHNVTTQGFRESEIGQPKVSATANAISEIDDSISIAQVRERYRHRIETAPVVFCCVDSISARSAIWRHLKHRTKFWCDGRMLGEVMRVLTATDDDSRQAYGRTLFNQSESQRGTCTSRSTIYSANIAAGLMLHQFSRWVRDFPTDHGLSLNLLSSEFNVA